MAKKKAALPENLYVRIQNFGSEDEYLDAHIDRDLLADDDSIAEVGHYELVAIVRLRKVVEEV